MTFDTAEQVEKLQKLLNKILPGATDPANADFAPGIVFGVTNANKTVYLESSGVSDIKTQKPMEKDAIFSMFSCTKAITTTAVLQLVEQGLLDLDAPATKYLPNLASVKVHKGKDADGNVIWASPKREITARMLLNHTAGFSYSFFSEQYAQVREQTGDLCIFDIRANLFDEAFLINEPGETWHYGLNIDFLGKIIESITGMSLGEFLKKSIFVPAGLDSFTFRLQSHEESVTLHFRLDDGVVVNSFQAIKDPVHELGGSGVFGTVDDYLKFIRIWLNKGKADNGTRILKEETVEFGLQNHWTDGVEDIVSHEKDISFSVPADKANPNGWCASFCLNTTDSLTGRPKGSVFWCGIANLFYWIDFENKIGGFYASQIFPFFEKSVKNYGELEAAVYSSV